ncbi:hypothetical protein COI93_00605 [Bacillus cereus]|uniref:Lipoprotein n=1 Tax=Bacillus cereus TaxID=1396 RepID=A0A2B0MXK7_BACCE|nr:hypothetical protein COI93_00605 [Bacillus cereus]
MKKFIMILILLLTGTLAACSNEVKVLGENEINKQKDVQKYISELQNFKIDYKGYKVFESPNSKSIVVNPHFPDTTPCPSS